MKNLRLRQDHPCQSGEKVITLTLTTFDFVTIGQLLAHFSQWAPHVELKISQYALEYVKAGIEREGGILRTEDDGQYWIIEDGLRTCKRRGEDNRKDNKKALL
ncbi:MAG: hypothetical protein EOP04_27230 [Proteobacteria bacterium]|nr:MAG: hypothetical protein EOP04_27230 [Pseudomonadota bacterium]